jgi:hypothetical protein
VIQIYPCFFPLTWEPSLQNMGFYLARSREKTDTEQIIFIALFMKVQFIAHREDGGFNCKQKSVNAL